MPRHHNAMPPSNVLSTTGMPLTSSSKLITKPTQTPSPAPLELSSPQDFPPLAAPTYQPSLPSRLQRKVTATNTAIKPVVPVLPTPSSRSTLTSKETQPKEKVADSADAPGSGAFADPGVILSSEQNSVETPAEKSGSKTPKAAKNELPTLDSKRDEKKQRPGKLDIAAAKDAAKVVQVADGSSTRLESVGKLVTGNKSGGPAPSEPPTPATAVSQTSMPSSIRQTQPRLNRAFPTSRAETDLASTDMAPPLRSKQASRKPSITSIHKPGTPTSERISDNVSFTSTSLSRANSPPNVVGSAPMRQVTKSQLKKERQARPKLTEGPLKSEDLQAKVKETIQGPIVGRKKKAKKEKSVNTSVSTPTVTRSSSPLPKEEAAEDPEEKSNPLLATPVKQSKKTATRAAADIQEPEIHSNPATPAASKQQKASPTPASILASLQATGELPGTVSELFKGIHGSNHRFEGIQPEISMLDDSMITDSEMRSLEAGEPIIMDKSPNDHILVLPDRKVLRGFTAIQASRYLLLRRMLHADGIEPSYGGLEALVPRLPASTARTSKHTTENKMLSNPFAPPEPKPEPFTPNMEKYGDYKYVPPWDEFMPNRKPTMSVEEADKALAAARKDLEASEKKLNAVMKKNRKLLFGNPH